MRKSQIKELYDKFLWLKCSMSVYYQRIKHWIDPFTAMKPVERKYEVRSKKYWAELERYNKQPQPKPPKQKFYWRLQKWYSKEEAIKIQLKCKDRKKRWQKDLYVKAYTVKEQQFKQDHFEIRITYHSDEAEVFRKEYERMIRETENQIYGSEDEFEKKELTKNLDDLIKEYAIFISYNSKQNESL